MLGIFTLFYSKDKCLCYKERIQSKAAILARLIAKKMEERSTEQGSESAEYSIFGFFHIAFSKNVRNRILKHRNNLRQEIVSEET